MMTHVIKPKYLYSLSLILPADLDPKQQLKIRKQEYELTYVKFKM